MAKAIGLPQTDRPKLSQAEMDAGKPLPFDHARAHRLHKALFGQVEDLIKASICCSCPRGVLTQLPFAVLVTAPPANGAHKTIAWFARDHAIMVLPAVSSLKALRATGHPSAAIKPLIGFGNPLLDGDDSQSPGAKFAREKQGCPTPHYSAGRGCSACAMTWYRLKRAAAWRMCP